MTDMTETVIDRYVALVDRAVHEPGALEELHSIFAPNATVQLDDSFEPLHGITAIMAFYKAFVGSMADSKHVWTTTVRHDGVLECRWVQAQRAVDGGLLT